MATVKMIEARENRTMVDDILYETALHRGSSRPGSRSRTKGDHSWLHTVFMNICSRPNFDWPIEGLLTAHDLLGRD